MITKTKTIITVIVKIIIIIIIIIIINEDVNLGHRIKTWQMKC